MASAILIILDGLGVGELPDAADYGDVGSDTLGNLARAVGGLRVPTLAALGLGNVAPIKGVAPVAEPAACFGRMGEISKGKDSTTGHWELMNVVTEVPSPTYPEGFPAKLLDAFSEASGHGVIGNEVASGTEIIQRLGDEHVRSGKLIVYTSADSVFQIAAHEDVVPIDELYRVCEVARDLLQPPHAVNRVIARPFLGTSGKYERTPRRHDYSLAPPPTLMLNALAAAGVHVVSVGKIYDLYDGAGIADKHASRDNREGMARLFDLYADADQGRETLFLLNLVDFDMLWGHRNDPEGMRGGLEAYDAWLEGFLAKLRERDLLLITADHGNDPTTPSTDHSREYVPLLALRPGCRGSDLGTRDSFADVGATLAEYFGIAAPDCGSSFLAAVKGEDS